MFCGVMCDAGQGVSRCVPLTGRIPHVHFRNCMFELVCHYEKGKCTVNSSLIKMRNEVADTVLWSVVLIY